MPCAVHHGSHEVGLRHMQHMVCTDVANQQLRRCYNHCSSSWLGCNRPRRWWIFFCYNHVLFLLELAHVFATTHPPNFCYQVIFAATDEPFCYNRFDFLLLPVFVDFCYIHLLFFLSFLLQPYFDFAGTEDIFCYIHPRRCCSTAAIVFFCYNRLGFLLLPEMPFATTRVFAISSLPGSIRSFCYHPLFLLEPS